MALRSEVRGIRVSAERSRRGETLVTLYADEGAPFEVLEQVVKEARQRANGKIVTINRSLRFVEMKLRKTVDRAVDMIVGIIRSMYNKYDHGSFRRRPSTSRSRSVRPRPALRLVA